MESGSGDRGSRDVALPPIRRERESSLGASSATTTSAADPAADSAMTAVGPALSAEWIDLREAEALARRGEPVPEPLTARWVDLWELDPSPARLLRDRLVHVLRARRYSPRTVESYVHWLRCFLVFHRGREIASLGAAEIESFLNHLAVSENIAAATQSHARGARLHLAPRARPRRSRARWSRSRAAAATPAGRSLARRGARRSREAQPHPAPRRIAPLRLRFAAHGGDDSAREGSRSRASRSACAGARATGTASPRCPPRS